MQRARINRPSMLDLSPQEYYHSCGKGSSHTESDESHHDDHVHGNNDQDSWSGLQQQSSPLPPQQEQEHGCELFRQARHVKELLMHQRAHVQLLKHATAKAVELSCSTPRRPGLATVSALHGMAAALSCSLQSAAAFAECFVEDVDALKAPEGVGMSDEEQYEAPSSVGWPSPRWSPPSAYSNPCWSGSCVIPLSVQDPFVQEDPFVQDPFVQDPFVQDPFVQDPLAQDPFVDALAAKTRRPSPPRAHALEYHPDATSLQWPVIFMGPPSPGSPPVGSRRVVVDNLPPRTALTQVLRAIRCYGGIVTASVVPGCASGRLTTSAVVEFVYADSAAAFADRCARASLAFAAEDASVFEARVWLVPTASFAYTARDHRLLSRGVTRAIALGAFPADAIWDLLVLVGTRAVTDVLPHRLDDVVLEFCSLFEADRAQRLIQSKWPGLHVGFVDDSSQGNHFQSAKTAPSVIGHVSPNHVHDTWNSPPFNHRTLAHYAHAVETEGQAAPSPNPTKKLAECFDISPSQLSSYLAERQAFPDTDYHVLGSNITITRRAWSWKLQADDDIKLLMANTLHEPDWADEWDQHFAAHGAVNLRTWERYGMLARHRRDKAAEQGIEGWRVPQCGAMCEWGCCDIKAVPVPRVVEQYLGDSNRASPAASEGGPGEHQA